MLYLSQFSTAPWYHVFFNKFFYSLLATDSLTQAGSSGTRFRAVLSRSMPREKLHNFSSRFWLVIKKSCNAFNAFFDQSGEKSKPWYLFSRSFHRWIFPRLTLVVRFWFELWLVHRIFVFAVIGQVWLFWIWFCVLVKRNSCKLNLLSDWHWQAKRSRKFSRKLQKAKKKKNFFKEVTM